MNRGEIISATNERLKDFIVNDRERIRRIAIKRLENALKKEELDKSRSKHIMIEERILNNSRSVSETGKQNQLPATISFRTAQ